MRHQHLHLLKYMYIPSAPCWGGPYIPRGLSYHFLPECLIHPVSSDFLTSEKDTGLTWDPKLHSTVLILGTEVLNVETTWNVSPLCTDRFVTTWAPYANALKERTSAGVGVSTPLSYNLCSLHFWTLLTVACSEWSVKQSSLPSLMASWNPTQSGRCLCNLERMVSTQPRADGSRCCLGITSAQTPSRMVEDVKLRKPKACCYSQQTTHS